MKLHFLVEGPSEAAFIQAWAPRLLKGHHVRVHPHEGKGNLPRRNEQVPSTRRGLLDQLPAKLRAYGAALDSASEAVVVLVDADEEDCVELRKRLDEVVAGIESAPKVLLRIAIEELEAFYLGDMAALARAYPEHDVKAARAYQPDSVCDTAELFGQIIGDGGLNKVSWAQAMAPKMTTKAAQTRSPSFRKLISGLQKLVTLAPKKDVKRRKWRHIARSKKIKNGRA